MRRARTASNQQPRQREAWVIFANTTHQEARGAAQHGDEARGEGDPAVRQVRQRDGHCEFYGAHGPCAGHRRVARLRPGRSITRRLAAGCGLGVFLFSSCVVHGAACTARAILAGLIDRSSAHRPAFQCAWSLCVDTRHHWMRLTLCWSRARPPR